MYARTLRRAAWLPGTALVLCDCVDDTSGEPIEQLQPRGILLDGSTEDDDPRLLLQIFSDTMIGPVFFEFIQRKKDEGFGEGNFKALFESIERDQVARGIVGDSQEAS